MDFYFDYISPYAYLAFTQLEGRARPVPVLFAGLLNAHGTKGPAEVPAKRDYIIKDVLRKAAALGVPFTPPPSHPFNPLLALRATIAEPRLLGPIFRAVWATGTGAETPDQIASLATAAGLSPADILARAASPAIKDQLRADTERAISLGVFGVPTMIADHELFWGVDSLPALERHLAGHRDADPALVERWRTMVASATRPSGSR